MKKILFNIFIRNWFRKFIALILALITWFVLNQTLITTKTIDGVGVKVINIPQGNTIQGLESNGYLNKRISLTLIGKRRAITSLATHDIEVIFDAATMGKEWIASVRKKNLTSFSPLLSISRDIIRVSTKNLIMKLQPITKETIPVYITRPIGEVPSGYQFLDIWPYHLNITVQGPDHVVKKLSSNGVKLTFNLDNINKNEIDRLANTTSDDVLSYFIPNDWKKILLPSISENAIKIDDPDAQFLRIDFIRGESLPIEFSLPISIFTSSKFKYPTPPLENSPLINYQQGIHLLNLPLYTSGISKVFLEIIKDHVAISINLTPQTNMDDIDWSIHFINSRKLEDQYVSSVLTNYFDDDLKIMNSIIRQEYLRNRFRNYMHRFQLYSKSGKLLNLTFKVQDKKIALIEESPQTLL